MSDEPQVLVRFWAGARRAAGHDTELVSAGTVGRIRELLAARPELAKISVVASFLVDGQQASDTAELRAGAEVDVLPPFAGGAESPYVVGFGGSTRRGSVTNEVLAQCMARIAEHGARVDTVAAEELAALPIYDGRPASGAQRLLEAIRAADCVVVATPGYHGGISGLVKNALDHLEALREDSRPYLTDRGVGVIVTAAGWQACGTALVSVRSAVHALRGWPTPFGLTMNSAEQTLADPETQGGIGVLAGQIGQFSEWQAAVRASAR